MKQQGGDGPKETSSMKDSKEVCSPPVTESRAYAASLARKKSKASGDGSNSSAVGENSSAAFKGQNGLGRKESDWKAKQRALGGEGENLEATVTQSQVGDSLPKQPQGLKKMSRENSKFQRNQRTQTASHSRPQVPQSRGLRQKLNHANAFQNRNNNSMTTPVQGQGRTGLTAVEDHEEEADITVIPGDEEEHVLVTQEPKEDGGLALAIPVDDNSMRDLQNAERVDVQPGSDKLPNKRLTQKIKLCLSLFVVILFIFVIAFVVVATRGEDETKNATGKVVHQIDQEVKNTTSAWDSWLPDYSRITQENEGSPQFLAYQWLMGDPNVTTYPDWRLQQRFALATVYYALRGDHWGYKDDWLSYKISECKWLGQRRIENATFEYCLGGIGGTLVSVDPCSVLLQDAYKGPLGQKLFPARDGEIQSIILSNNFARGELPPEIALLTRLALILLDGNLVEGALPSQIGQLTSLVELSMKANRITMVPSEIGKLTNLTHLDLGNNRLQGTIPTTIGQWVNLRHLFLEENSLQGKIPSEIAMLSALEKLHLFRNDLMISIPTEMGQMTMLRELLVAENNLPTTIPTEFGLLTSLRLFDAIGAHAIDSVNWFPANYEYEYGTTASRHRYQGTIPSELGMLSLETLDLAHSLLTGTIPTNLGKYPFLFLQNNSLHGQIPSDLVGAIEMNLSRNNLDGTIPSSIGSNPNLEVLDLSNNNLVGPIPTELGRLNREVYPCISGIGLCTEAFRRRLRDCAEPFNSLKLSGNSLTGPIPTELGLLRDVSRMDLSNNQLTGTLPSQLGLLTMLQYFNVGSNAISGHIAGELGDLLEIQSFNMSDNLLTGFLPTELCQLNTSALLFDCSLSLCGCSCSCE